jgi:hypothetical protein
MDVLIVEPLDPDVLHWLGARHAVVLRPTWRRTRRPFRPRWAACAR